MKIHHIISERVGKYFTDPMRGNVYKEEDVLRSSDVHAITHEGVTYTKGDDGTFEVPQDVANFFLARRDTGTWREGANPFAEIPAHTTTSRSPRK